MHRIAYITDLHLNEDFTAAQGTDPIKNWNRIVADLQKRNIDRIVFGGDIGSIASTEWMVDALMRTGKPFHITPGNHDSSKEILKYYNPGENFPSGKMYGNILIENKICIFLDSSTDAVDDEQLQWLRKILQGNTSAIIFIHHPVVQIPVMVDQLYPLMNRDEVKEIMMRSASQIHLFSGHYHFNHEPSDGNIHQVVTMASSCQIGDDGAQLTIDPSIFGYRIIELHDDEVTSEVIEFARDAAEMH